MSARQVVITVLAVTGATCEACNRAAVVSARGDDRDGVRYYCPAHIALTLRPLRLASHGIRHNLAGDDGDAVPHG